MSTDNAQADSARLKPNESGGAELQKLARAYVVALNGALRAIRLYPVENVAVQRAIGELGSCAERVIAHDGECALKAVSDFLFLNETRLRLAFDNYAAVASLIAQFRASGIGGIALARQPGTRDWVVLLSALQAPASGEASSGDDDRMEHVLSRLASAQVDCFVLSEPGEEGERSEVELDARERARQTYVQSMGVTRDFMTSVRFGKYQGLKRVKRAVQGIVDSILTDPASLIGLTTLRDFDEYTFVHSVNVCILSVALGRRLGLTKPQLLDLGLAALLFDLGKTRLPLELLNKRGTLDENERELLQTHSWQGVLALFGIPGLASRPWRAMTAAYEHHMRTDLSGYPRCVRPRTLSLYSKIIAVCDGFDAATTSRVFRDSPWTPSDVLRGMRDNRRLGLDPVVVKAFINLTGIHPVGTLVLLDTFEIALVMAANPDASALSRPIVRVLMDDLGNPTVGAMVVDLTEKDETGQYRRSIIRAEDPHRYGINIGDYFA